MIAPNHVEALKEIAARAPSLILVGGTAAWLYGNERFTRDLDFVPSPERRAWSALMGALRELGYIPHRKYSWTLLASLPNLRSAMILRGDVNVPFRHTKTGMQIDLLVHYGKRHKRYAKRALKRTVDGVKIMVARLEDLIELKEDALRHDPDRIQDRQDLAYLTALQTKQGRA